MGLYNMLFGYNEHGPLILATLGLTPQDTGRYRDCYVEKFNDTDYRIVIYTRNGGGNRDEYQLVIDTLAEHPCYLSDQDDDFDCTYAYIYFSLPNEYATELKMLADQQPFTNPSEKWTQLLDALNKQE